MKARGDDLAIAQLAAFRLRGEVQRLLADTQRPPAEVLAEFWQKVAEINGREK